MNVYENPEVVRWAVSQAQDRMKRAVTETIHASEITQGLRKSYYQRTQPREWSGDDTLYFAAGFAIQEWFLGGEPPSIERDGITLSVDQFADGEVLEFKSTRRSYEKYALDATGKQDRKAPKERFDPASMEQWIARTKLYCAAHGKTRAHILVFFIYQTELHAWTVEFSPQELSEAWEWGWWRASTLRSALAVGEPPPVTTCEPWEHERCPFLDLCMNELQKVGYEPQ